MIMLLKIVKKNEHNILPTSASLICIPSIWSIMKKHQSLQGKLTSFCKFWRRQRVWWWHIQKKYENTCAIFWDMTNVHLPKPSNAWLQPSVHTVTRTVSRVLSAYSYAAILVLDRQILAKMVMQPKITVQSPRVTVLADHMQTSSGQRIQNMMTIKIHRSRRN